MLVRLEARLAMSLADRPAPVERALLAAGTSSYDCPDYPALGKVLDALRDVVGALKGLGFTTVVRSPGYRLDPSLKGLRSAVRKAAAAAPVVVLYYTGHGADVERGTYYLVSKKSRLADLDESALAARDLLTLLTLRDDHGEPLKDQPTVLVILDCCYAGSAGMDMLKDALLEIGNPNTWVIASAGRLEYAQQGLFATAFCDALQRPTAGPSQHFVSLEAIAQAINDAHSGRSQQQARVFPPAAGLTGIPPFFPNPNHRPGRTVDKQHWISRARAGPDESKAGFYLTGKTGRLRAAQDLAEWMTDPGPKNLAVVTGSPGTGKSALLALPALLTEQSQRQELLSAAKSGSLIEHTASLLPVDTPVTAVHAHGLNTDQTAGAVAQALGRDASTASGLLEVLETTPQQDKRIVVVDAIDEATHPATLLSGLLLPLSRLPEVRVVVGGRRHVLAGVGETDATIDLDASTYRDPGALTDYAYRLLVAAEEPGVTTCYQPGSGTADGGPGVAAAVAGVIAQRATAREPGGESFLIGRLLALSLRDRLEPVDVSNPDWQSELPASVAEAFDQDLARLEHQQPLARALLEALAWAKGPGLPWEMIWVPVARALAERTGTPGPPPITNDDVRWLLEKAGAYVVEDLGPGQRSAFRPFHDLFATHLRGEPSSEQIGSDPTANTNWQQRRHQAEKAITEALLATVPSDGAGRRDWVSAHPYLRTYLAQHAAAAGPEALSAVVQDADFLAAADPVTLSPLLAFTVPELRETARIYRRARPLLGDDPHANAAYLQEATRALTGAATKHTGMRPFYRTHLASVRRDDSLLTLRGHRGTVSSVAFGAGADGRLLLASGGYDGTVRVWDPVIGGPAGQPLTGHTSRVSSVAFGTGPDGGLLLASGSEDKTVRLWDPVTGAPVGGPLTGHTGTVSSVAFGAGPDGGLLLASGSEDKTVRLWDPVTGVPVGGPLTGHTDGVTSVAFGVGPDGGLLLASGSEDKTVRLWDPVTGAQAGGPLTGHTDAVNSVAFGVGPNGRLLLASGSSDQTVRVWDPVIGAPAGEPLTGHTDAVNSVAFGTGPDGRLLLASASWDKTVRLWGPVTGPPAGEQLTGHTRPLTSVAFGTGPDGRLLLASASWDKTVRLWDPVTGAPAGEPPTGHTDAVNSVAFGTGPGGLLLASCSSDQTVRVWDPVIGAPAGEPLTGHTDAVNSVAFGTGPGGLLLASCSSDQTVRLWDPVIGAPAGEPLTGHRDAVNSVAFGTGPDGRLLLASASWDKTVRLWDPVTGAPAGEPLTGHTDAVNSVAFGTGLDGRLLLASGSEDKTVRLWDPVTGAPAGEPLTGHRLPVTSVAFGADPDGRLLLASASWDKTVRLWDPVTGAPAGEPLTGHTSFVYSVAFEAGPDGRLLLACGGRDNTVRLWNSVTWACIATLQRRSSVHSIAAAGLTLAFGDDEGTSVIEWDGRAALGVCGQSASTSEQRSR